MSTYILLSAGCGRSMMTKGAKPLLIYDGFAVIDHQIKTILSYDKSADILVVTGVGHEKIVKHVEKRGYDIRLLLNYSYKLTSQTESLRLAINACRTDSTYIIHGDMIFNKPAIACNRTKTSIMLDKGQSDKKGVGATQQNGFLMNLSYGLPDKWAQVAFISKRDFPIVKAEINSFRNNKTTFEFLNMLAKKIKFAIVDKDVKTIEISRNYEELSD